MEVFQSTDEAGELTICLDGAETIKLSFKKTVQVSVSYLSKSQNASDVPVVMKTEACTTDYVQGKKSDPLDEELNGFIERVKNKEGGSSDLFPNPAKNLFVEENTANATTTTTTAANNSQCGSTVHESGDKGNNVDVNQAESDNKDNVKISGCIDFESGMDVDEDDAYDDHDNDGDLDMSVEDSGIRDVDQIKDNGIKEIAIREDSKDQNVNNEVDRSEVDTVAKYAVKSVSKMGIKDASASEKSTDAAIRRNSNETKPVKRDSIRKPTPPTPTTPSSQKYLKLKDGKKFPTAAYKCSLCEKVFRDSYTLSIHQRAENTRVMCKMCDLECNSKANLIIHEHLMHSKSGRIAGKMCPVCLKSFDKHSDILTHIRCKHTNEGLYRCCVCNILFQSFQTFKFHLDTHQINKKRLLAKDMKSKQPVSVNSKKEVDSASKVHSSSSEVGKKLAKISPATIATSTASKRKSSTPKQLRSLMNFQPPPKPTNPPPVPAKITPSSKSVKSRATGSAASTPVSKPVSRTPPSSKLVSRTSASKPVANTPQTSKAVARTPTSKPTMTKTPVMTRAMVSASTIKKQVLASRLKPVVTPSMLASRKRPLYQLPAGAGGGGGGGGRFMAGRGPLKTLPRVSSLSQHSKSLTQINKKLARVYPMDKLWKCHFCERVFRTKGEYISHKKPSRIVQTCRECGFTSTSKALYLIHEYQKHTNKNNDRYILSNEDLRCHICEEPIKLTEVLNHVMSKHTAEHPYECCVCKKPSKAYDDWVSHGKSHVRSTEEKKSFASNKLILNLTVKTEESEKSNEMFCNLCKHYYPNEEEFVRHHRSETRIKECEICRTMCYTEAGYMIHKYISHSLSPGDNTNQCSSSLPSTSFGGGTLKRWNEDDVANDNNSDITNCPSCEQPFPMKNLLSHVMNTHTQESPYKCCSCKTTCSNLEEYIEHCDFHMGRKLYRTGTQTQRCLVCGLRFDSRIRLSRHKMMHKPSCPYCQVEFNSKALLDVHLKNHHVKDMTACGFCGKLFADSNQLAEHERNHYFYKKSPCPICGASVTNVTKHLARVHPKPDTHFLCNLCGQKFPLRCDLARHMSKHSTDRRHECDICKKTFKRSSGLRRHAQSHLQDRKFHECHICGKKCSQRNNLSVHMRVHSATKAFTCEHCGQGFNYNQSLQTHIRKKHTNESGPAPTAISDKTKLEPMVQEALVNHIPATATTANPQPNPVVATAIPGAYQEHPEGYPMTDTSQHYYHHDPSGFVPVNAAFHRSYSDLINTIVRSEHDTQQAVPPQNHPVYYPQF